MIKPIILFVFLLLSTSYTLQLFFGKSAQKEMKQTIDFDLNQMLAKDHVKVEQFDILLKNKEVLRLMPDLPNKLGKLANQPENIRDIGLRLQLLELQQRETSGRIAQLENGSEKDSVFCTWLKAGLSSLVTWFFGIAFKPYVELIARKWIGPKKESLS